MKFAAILGAAAVLTAGAASAAEIGVRHTWGTSDRHINHGQSMYERTVNGSYSEDSKGFALGIKANDFYVDYEKEIEFGAGGGFGADVDLVTTGELDGGKLFGGFGSLDQEVDLTTTGTISGGFGFGGSADYEEDLYVDGKLNVAGSVFTRSESGHIRETAKETYNFSGSSSSGFSELSTFSR